MNLVKIKSLCLEFKVNTTLNLIEPFSKLYKEAIHNNHHDSDKVYDSCL